MRALRAACLAGVTLAMAVGMALPAGAHSDVGTLGIEVTPGAAPRAVQVRALLEYANDREVAPGATVVAEATGPAGTRVGPVPLSDEGRGVYSATLTVPADGTWAVTVTATNPTATASASVTVPDAATTTTGEVQISADRAAQDDRRSDDGGPSPAMLAAIAAVLVAATGTAFVMVRRR